MGIGLWVFLYTTRNEGKKHDRIRLMEVLIFNEIISTSEKLFSQFNKLVFPLVMDTNKVHNIHIMKIN